MGVCKQCGTSLNDWAKFCDRCGKENDEYNPYAPPKQGVPVSTAAVKKNPWTHFICAFEKYAVFKGRARRAEYWWFSLFVYLFSVIFILLDRVFDMRIWRSNGLLGTVWGLATFLPRFSVSVRRMHDCDNRGWVLLIPIYSTILFFVKGTSGPNRFGPDPREENDQVEEAEN